MNNELLAELSAFISEKLGIHFPAERRADLQRGIEEAAKQARVEDVEQFARMILTRPLTRPQIESLAGFLTVGETYFYREPGAFKALKEKIVPEIVASRNNSPEILRIWSAGCCTGEEPYSIAMTLPSATPYFSRWQITILGTDINPHFLRRASEAVYGEWSFRDVPAWLKQECFDELPGRKHRVVSRFRSMVTLSFHNLAEDSFPSLANNTNAMDIIFCRNVLMYFSRPRAAHVISNFSRALVPGGWLVVGQSEIAHDLMRDFEMVRFDDAILYKKKSAAANGDLTLPPPKPEFGPAEDILCGQEETVEPVPVPTPFEIARALANGGRLEEALIASETGIESDKINPAGYHLCANILFELGRLAQARMHLKHAIYLDPDFALAHFLSGIIAVKEGKRDEAQRCFSVLRRILKKLSHDTVLPESDGITAGRLAQILDSTYEG